RNIALAVVSIFAVLAVLSSVLAWEAKKQAIEQAMLAEQARITAEEQRALAEQQKKTAEEQRHQADGILGKASSIIVDLQNQMNEDTKKKVFAIFQEGADHGDAVSMRNLGISYYSGFGVAKDYAKTLEWWKKAADNGNADAMVNLGMLYDNGLD